MKQRIFIILLTLSLITLPLLWAAHFAVTTALVPDHPQVIVFISSSPQESSDAQFGETPTRPSSSTLVTTAAVVVLHPNQHHRRGFLVSSPEPFIASSTTSDDAVYRASQQLGLVITELVKVDSSVSAAPGNLQWQLLQKATSIWQQPAAALHLVELALLIPTLETVETVGWAEWGRQEAQAIRPLESRSTDCTIGISNTVGVTGLGGSLANLLSLQGASVRRLTDSDSSLTHTQILLDASMQTQCRELTQAILHLLPPEIPLTTQENVIQQYRVPIMILLGNDATLLLKENIGVN